MSDIGQLELHAALLGGLTFGAVNGLHCIGMCGPLVAATHGGLRTGLGYHAARAGAYAALGVLAGAFGAAVGLDTFGEAGAGFAFVLAGVMLLAAFGGGHLLGGLPLVGRVVQVVHREITGLPPGLRGVAVGLLTPLLPCGLLWAALAIAAAAGAHGWAAMLGFALGGVPGLAFAQWNFGWLRARIGMHGARRLARGALVLAALVVGWRGWAQVSEGAGGCCGHAVGS